MSQRHSVRPLVARVFRGALLVDGLLVAVTALYVLNHTSTGDSDMTGILLYLAAAPASLILIQPWVYALVAPFAGVLPGPAELVLVGALDVLLNSALVAGLVGAVAAVTRAVRRPRVSRRASRS